MQIIAHRGDATTALDNTIEAFENAYQAGADGIEFDVRLSADGVPVVHHNMMLSTETANGFVEDYTLEQILKLNRIRDGVRYKIPTLADVLEKYCGKTYLEIHVLSYNPQVVRAVAECLQPYRPHWEMCEITSYDPAILLGFQQHCAGLTRDFLFRADDWMTHEMAMRVILEKATLGNASNVHLFAHGVTSETVERFESAGFGVHVGVVNTLADVDAIQSAGVERFTTDNIHLFIGKFDDKHSDGLTP